MEFVYVLITCVVNVVVVLFYSALLDGIVRKLNAVLQSRIGPPIYQTIIDIFKLLRKEVLISGLSAYMSVIPYIVFAFTIVIALLIPIAFVAPLSFAGDVIVLLYSILMTHILIVLAAMSSGNPFSAVGSSRMLTILIPLDIALILSVIARCISVGSINIMDITLASVSSLIKPSQLIASIVLVILFFIEIERKPFDVIEAETEIAGGPLIEWSGLYYALIKWSIISRYVIIPAILYYFFLPWPYLRFGTFALTYLCNLAIFMIKTLILTLFVPLLDSSFPRFRVDYLVRFTKYPIILSLIAFVLSLVGL